MKFVLSTSFSEVGHLAALAPVADECGWEAMSFSDHVVHLETISHPYPYTETGERRWEAFTEWPDPWVLIGGLSTITTRLRFTNNIFVLPMRNPLLVAKAIGTASLLSGGRITPAFGVGWSPDEFALLQQDFSSRGKRIEEMLDIMRLVWTGEMVEYSGKYYQFPRLEMNPAPPGPIPVWLGGISQPAMRRAARLADGWVTDLQPAAEIIESIRQINAWREECGRESARFEVMATPSDVQDYDGYRRLEDEGVTHILIMPWHEDHGPTATLAQKLESIQRYAEEMVLPLSA